MDLLYNQLNLRLSVDLDIEAQEETKAHGTDKVYKLKVTKKFEHIMFAIFILEETNGFHFVYSYICYQF